MTDEATLSGDIELAYVDQLLQAYWCVPRIMRVFGWVYVAGLIFLD